MNIEGDGLTGWDPNQPAKPKNDKTSGRLEPELKMRHGVVKHSFGENGSRRCVITRVELILWFNTNELKQLFKRHKRTSPGTLKRRLLLEKELNTAAGK